MSQQRNAVCVKLTDKQLQQLNEDHIKTGISRPELLRKIYFGKEAVKVLMSQQDTQRYLNTLRDHGRKLVEAINFAKEGNFSEFEKILTDISDEYRILRRVIVMWYGNT